MGCDFGTSRAELAPQVVQEVGDKIKIEDVIDYVEDALSGLMATSMIEQSATRENHCAMVTEVCLPFGGLLYHRVFDEDCKGGDEAGEGVLNR